MASTVVKETMRTNTAQIIKRFIFTQQTTTVTIVDVEYWIHFKARFRGVHAFGYNSIVSESIWMKSGALRVHYWGHAMADFGRQ